MTEPISDPSTTATTPTLPPRQEHELEHTTHTTPTFGEVIVDVRDLAISYKAGDRDVPITSGIEFTLREGETLGLVGESGSGKSTVARTLLGHLRAGSRVDHGSVHVFGEDVFAMSPARLQAIRGGEVALVSQNAGHALTPSMKVGAQIQEALATHGLPAGKSEVVDLVRLVRLPDPEHLVDRYPHELSGGQQQRIAIAMAVATNPRILVLDEPTTALDVITQAAVLALVDDLRQRLGMSVLIVSHDLGVVSAIADNVLVMNQGRTVEQGSARAVLDSPQDDYTKGLLAAAPRLHAPPGEPEPAPGPHDPQAPVLLACEGLDIRYPRAHELAVRDVALQLRRGETLAVVGESGSGKSTVAMAIAGLALVEAGTVRLSPTEQEVHDLLQPIARRTAEVRRSVQMVFQNSDLALNPRRSVGDAIARPLRFFRRTSGRAETKAGVDRLLAEVGLNSSFAGRVPAQLSGGQRQRVGIARALAADPSLLIADEITTALDVAVQAEVLELLDELRRRRDLSCLFISHDLAVVKSVAHRVVVMKDGRVVESGPTPVLFSDPQHPYTRTLLDSVEPGGATLPSVDVEGKVDHRGLDAVDDSRLVEVAAGHHVRLDSAGRPA